MELNSIEWFYTPIKNGKIQSIKIGTSLYPQLKGDSSCCSGTYSAEIQLPDLINYLDGQAGILFPSIGGLRKVYIDGQEINLPRADYSSVGPIISLSSNIQVSRKFKIEIDIQYKTQGLAGMWNGTPVFGSVQDLASIRQLKIFWQKLFPLIEAVVFLSFSLIFLWLYFKVKSESSIYIEFSYALFSWALFYLFLSGEVRELSSRFAQVLHFPSWILAHLAIVRLVSIISKLPQTVLRRMSDASIVIILCQIVAGIFFYDKLQIWLCVVMHLMTLYCLSQFRKLKKNLIMKVIYFSYALAMTVYIFDTVKMLAHLYGVIIPLPFLDRYLAFPFLLLSIYYLAYQLSQDAVTALRVRTAEELSLQAAHDIQSPLAAITVAMKGESNQSMPQESKDLVLRAIDRIRSIISSLKEAEIRKLNFAVISSKEFLQELVDEKRYQFKSNKLVSIQLKIMKLLSGDWVRVDSIEFARVISNLINNAVESAVPNEKIEVIVSIGSSKKVVEISIVDNGRGMTKDLLKVIGQRGASSGKPGGMGLGVYHAKKQIESWGGKLKIESRVNRGSRVSILLPRKEV
jgi:signal transduction histidine kinase